MRQFLNDAFQAAALKVVGASASLVVGVGAVRLLGAEQAGRFFLCTTVVAISATVGRLGLENHVLRSVANKGGGLSRADAATAGLLAGGIALVLGVVVSLAAQPIGVLIFSDPEMVGPMRAMAWSIPALALFVLTGYLLLGGEQPARGIFFLNVAYPLSVLSAGLLWLTGTGFWAHPVAMLPLVVVSLFVWWARVAADRPQGNRQRVAGVLRVSVPLGLISVAQILNAWLSQLILGSTHSKADVAAFTAIVQVALLLGFVLSTVAQIVAGRFANAHGDEDLSRLRRLHLGSTAAVLAGAIPLIGVLWFAGEKVLALYEPAFAVQEPALRLLLIAQFANACSGPTGVLLLMTHRESILRTVLLGSLVVHLLLAAALVPALGVLGAAWAMAASVVASSVCSLLVVLRVVYWPGPGPGPGPVPVVQRQHDA